MPATAQDRMPPIPAERLNTPEKGDGGVCGRTRPTSPVPGPVLRSPEVMNRARAMGDYLRHERAAAAAQRIRHHHHRRQWTQNYEWDVHAPLAQQGGLKRSIIAAVADGRRPAEMAEDEDVLYTFCDELHRNQSVSDATYDRTVKTFGEQGVIDILGISGYYTMLAMVLNTSRTPVPPGHTPALRAFPH